MSRFTAHHQEVLFCIYSTWYVSCVYVGWLLAGSGWNWFLVMLKLDNINITKNQMDNINTTKNQLDNINTTKNQFQPDPASNEPT